MDLRRWQSEAKDFFLKHKIAIIEAATGSGKTRFAIDVIKTLLEEEPSLRVLIVTPKNVILEKTWFNNLTKEFPITQVGIFYGEAKEEAQITATNMQSIDKIDVTNYDMLIFDELHNYFSKRMQEYLKLPMKYKMGLTATLHQKEYKHWEVLKIFDFNLFRYDIEEAVKENVLSHFIFNNVPIDLEEDEKVRYKELQERIDKIAFALKNTSDMTKETQYKAVDDRKKLLSNSPAKRDVIAKLIPYIEGKKIIVFNEYNAIATPTYWSMVELGLRPCIFNTSISKKVRMQNLEDYATDKYDTIITTRALDEGYDLPKIDVAIILSGGNTSRQMIQRVGRVLRKTKNDKEIYQVYFKDTIEEEMAFKRYELMKDSCKEYKELML